MFQTQESHEAHKPQYRCKTVVCLSFPFGHSLLTITLHGYMHLLKTTELHSGWLLLSYCEQISSGMVASILPTSRILWLVQQQTYDILSLFDILRLSLLGIQLGVIQVAFTVGIFLIFWGTCILFINITVLFYTSNNSMLTVISICYFFEIFFVCF